MRLTRFLLKQRWTHHRRLIWKNKGVYRPEKLPPVAQSLGITPVDVHKFLYPPNEEEKWQPPPGDLRFEHFTEKVPETEKKDYHEETLYHLSTINKFSEGINQACMLTKTQSFEGFPTEIQDLIGKVSIKDQELCLQRAIMQSQVWDSARTLLPRHIDRENLQWKFARTFGITHKRSASILLSNMIRMCQGLVGQYPSMLDRQFVLKPGYETVYKYKDFNLRIASELECLAVGRKPFKPFGDAELVKESVDYTLPDMYPVLPTIDLNQTNNYTIREQGVLKDKIPTNIPSQPLLMFAISTQFWKPEYKQAYNIMQCFGFAAQEARRLYGPTVKELPQPITLINVNMDWTTLNFLCFQLNTVDVSTDEGVKNFVWYDSGNKMFVKHHPQPWKEEEMYKKFRYTDFNPEPFEKFLAVFLHGLPELQENT